MHDIEPHFKWRGKYMATEDKRSPFYDKVYDEFKYTHKIYNYVIHPQWDAFGSATLYLKLLFVEYDESYAIIELMGEWNDCLTNDIMFFKREIIDLLVSHGIFKYILICENVLNFHGSDDCYYEEWYDDIKEDGGWICLLNVFPHVEEEMKDAQLQYFINFGLEYAHVNWRPHQPEDLFSMIEAMVNGSVKRLSF